MENGLLSGPETAASGMDSIENVSMLLRQKICWQDSDIKSTPEGFQALVFGASGITGWAIVNESLTYPTSTTFSRIIGLTSRPLTVQDAGLPQDPRLQLYAGLDLSKDIESTVAYLHAIPGIEHITHVYFAAYVHLGWGASDSASRARENVKFLTSAVTAIETECPNLHFFTFPTGGKWYGFEFGNAVERVTPLKESAPRVGSPQGDHIFYYYQIDALERLNEGKKWKYADIRPDAIIGFVPNHNAMNLAEPIALYCSLWKSLETSDEIPFPGTTTTYTSLHSDCSQDLVARIHIFASLHPEKTGGEAYNIADADVSNSWEAVWPGIAAYFGLKGVGPPPNGQLAGEPWVKSRSPVWEKWTAEKQLKPKVLESTCWGFMTILANDYATFDRSFDISKARSIGFDERRDHVQSYHIAFDRMRDARIIPTA
ncbi:hypothetical protein LTR36_002773 [Oleoguttula mirabilis]|uniref:PRISE-like Rossmann-fold domain-containing protein n=1 Tax=Oleoguttula mirabilis TaxID=1507867 RepID=A0AAV9JKI5_9PEZI|nr:hypothetical protein LTR36_002773 [Oleoguttula mirabilis]